MDLIVLNASSPFEIEINKTVGARLWQSFLDGGSMHSSRATTLPYIIRRCERERIPYRLTATPTQGYFIEPLK